MIQTIDVRTSTLERRHRLGVDRRRRRCRRRRRRRRRRRYRSRRLRRRRRRRPCRCVLFDVCVSGVAGALEVAWIFVLNSGSL